MAATKKLRLAMKKCGNRVKSEKKFGRVRCSKLEGLYCNVTAVKKGRCEAFLPLQFFDE